MTVKRGSVDDMNRAIASMNATAENAFTGKPVVAVVPMEDTLTELRRWRLQAGVRFVGKSLNVKGPRK